jgi:hypothetical protein
MNPWKFHKFFIFIAVLLAFSMAVPAYAEKTVVVKMGQEPRCEGFSVHGKPDNVKYTVEGLWIKKEGVVRTSYDENKGEICFEPLNTGNTRVKIHGKVQEFDLYGQVKETRKFYRSFRVKVRTAY